MSTLLRTALTAPLSGLRHEPTAKRIRAKLGDRTVVDSTRALLVWEPRRVVPAWAVPVQDVHADMSDAGQSAPPDTGSGYSLPGLSQRPVLDPSIPFAVHTTDGHPVDLRVDGQRLEGAAFRPEDEDLAGYLVLDFDAFDSWWEEDARAVAHPRDPFHRIDTLPSSRSVRVELNGAVLAESCRPVLLFETFLPTRYYFPPEDVRVPLSPTDSSSTCAYKGRASYFAATVGGDTVSDVAWSYQDPLPEASAVKGLLAFFDEHVDVVLDGQPVNRPVTPWSRRPEQPKSAPRS